MKIDRINFVSKVILIILLPIIFFLNWYLNDIFELKVYVPYFYQVLKLYLYIEIPIYLLNLYKKRFKINIYDILLYLLIILLFISTYFAVDSYTSLHGASTRYEGLYSLLCYYLLFLNSKQLNIKYIKRIIDIFIYVGLIQFLFCFCQIFFRGFYSVVNYSKMYHMASGFIGNPNMLGSYVIMLLSITTILYLINSSKKYFILSVIFFVNLIFCQSTGPFLSYLIVLFFSFIYLFKSKKINLKKIFIFSFTLIIVFVFTNFITSYITNNVYYDDLENNYTIVGDIENIKHLEIGSGRIDIWKKSIKLVPKYLWTGAGLDNFGYIYNDNFNVPYCDKAHNVYLQMLLTNGIFALIIYLVLVFIVFKRGVEIKNDLQFSIFATFFAYSIQAFANISVVNVAPFFYILMGLLVCFEKNS